MVVLLVLAMILPPSLVRAPAPAGASAPASSSWVLYDESFDYEIASYRADLRGPMASTTKLMTALVVVEQAELSEEVVISRRAQATGHKQIGLVAGDRWTVGELLEAVMVVSANDAAVALAEHVGGTVEGFVEMMNQRAAALGLDDTAYVNPHGLDAAGHYTTARDLLTLGREVMAQPVLADLAGRRVADLEDADGSTSRRPSTNDLLGSFDGAIGVKTGWTTRSGEVLVAAAERTGRRVYAVVMGSDDAAAEAAALLERGFRAFGMSERRLVPLLEDRRRAPALWAELSNEAVARVAHLRGLWKREVAQWE